MCGRFTLHTEKEALAREFGVDLSGIALAPRYNIAPQQQTLVVRERGGERVPAIMRWGLLPRWARPLEKLPPMINARRETVATRRAYRDSFRSRRCVVPADGFYEWASSERRGPRQPHWIGRVDRRPFAMAGLWDAWRGDEDEEPVYTFTIVTGPANPLVCRLHDRMPLLIPREAIAVWLAPEAGREQLLRLLERGDDAPLEEHPVSTEVNAPQHDHAGLIEPVELAQPSLF